MLEPHRVQGPFYLKTGREMQVDRRGIVAVADVSNQLTKAVSFRPVDGAAKQRFTRSPFLKTGININRIFQREPVSETLAVTAKIAKSFHFPFMQHHQPQQTGLFDFFQTGGDFTLLRRLSLERRRSVNDVPGINFLHRGNMLFIRLNNFHSYCSAEGAKSLLFA